jgi:predicted nucleotidyltransferase
VSTAQVFDDLVFALTVAVRIAYGDRLVSLVVFGSVGRGSARPDSDLDFLVVADGLPDGRSARVAEFERVEGQLTDTLEGARAKGVTTALSPLFKTPAEADRGSPLFLDLVEDARICFDRGDFFAHLLARLRARLAALGARRVWRGARWYWDLKPDFKPGDVVEL